MTPIGHPPSIDASSRDHWSPDVATLLARRACDDLGSAGKSPELIRFGTNAVFALSDAGLILRLRRPGTASDEIAHLVNFARWLAEEGVPVNRPASELPIADQGLEGAVASFWEWVDHDPEKRVGVEKMGALMRTFHDISNRYPNSHAFPTWSPVAEIEHRIDHLSRVRGSWPPADQLELMRIWTDETAAAMRNVEWRLPVGLIHGDAHTGNVLYTGSDSGVIIDLDAVSRGPREWDLVPTAVSRLRFHGDLDSISRLSDGYGFDLIAWEGWGTLRRLRELYMTSWLMSVATSARRRTEVDLRIDCLRSDDIETRWHAV